MSLLKLDEAKRHLNLTGNGQDAEVQSFIDAAESRLSEEVGALVAAERTDRVCGGPELVLPALPVASLTSVTTADGDDLDTDALHLDNGAGIVSLEDGGTFGSRHYDVTYTPGLDPVPARVKLATKELVRHLWKTQRGMMRPDVESDPSATFSLPRRVLELIERDTARQSGFA